MPIAELSNVLNIFREKEMSSDAKEDLFKEVMLMTLARASSSDANIDPVEVTTVQDIMKRLTGEELTSADIRLASRPALFKEAPFQRRSGSRRSSTLSVRPSCPGSICWSR